MGKGERGGDQCGTGRSVPTTPSEDESRGTGILVLDARGEVLVAEGVHWDMKEDMVEMWWGDGGSRWEGGEGKGGGRWW